MATSAIQSFFTLSTQEKGLFLEAWVRLALFRIAIALLPFSRLTRSLSSHSQPDSGPLSPQHHNTALLIRTAIRRAANHTPWESACLVQALCAQRMLKNRNISGSLHLGVMQEGKDSETFKAHAWVQCQDLIICGAFQSGEFREISVQSWTEQ